MYLQGITKKCTLWFLSIDVQSYKNIFCNAENVPAHKTTI